MLAFVAGALGLAPSYDVFISNHDLPEGFVNPHAARDAITRALSAGIVGLRDEVGNLDWEVVIRLAFPDGVLTQPDHTSCPAASSLQSNTLSFYTETVVSGYQRTYLTLFNLSEEAEEYTLDLGSTLGANDSVVFDCNAGALISERVILGRERAATSSLCPWWMDFIF